MHVVLVEQRQHLLGVGEALGVPFEHGLVGLEAPGRRLRQGHGVDRDLVLAHAAQQGHGLRRHFAAGLLQPRAHRPQHGLAGAAGQRGVLIEDFGGLAGKQEHVQHHVVDTDDVGRIGRRRADRVLDAAHRVDVQPPAARAPCQRQGAMLGIVGDHGFFAAVQVARGFAQAVHALVRQQGEACRPDRVVGLVQRVVPECGRMRGNLGLEHPLFIAVERKAHRVGLELQGHIALSDAPTVPTFARGDGGLAHRLLAREQHLGHGARTRAGLVIGKVVRLAAAQAKHTRRMRLDYQVQPIARVEIDATGAGRQQLDGVELGSMGKVELGRHRASPGLSQKPSKDAILTDLSFEINSVPLLDGDIIQKKGSQSPRPASRESSPERPRNTKFAPNAGLFGAKSWHLPQFYATPFHPRRPRRSFFQRGAINRDRSVSRGDGSPQSRAAIRSPISADQDSPRDA